MLPVVPLASILSRDLEKKFSGIVAIEFPDDNDDDVFVIHSDPFWRVILRYSALLQPAK